MKFTNILIIRFSSLGDILLTFPVYRNIKKHFPNAKITVLTKKQFAQAVSSNRYIDETISFDGLGKTVNLINSRKFDLIIDLHSNLRSFIIMALTKAGKKIRYKKDSLYRKIFVNYKIITPALEKHTVERYLDTLKELGIKTTENELYIDEIKKDEQKNPENPKKILVLQTAFLGDSILSLPLVKNIKNSFPNAKLSFLVRAENKQVFSNIKEIDEIIEDNKKNAPFLKELLRLAKELKKRDFDIAIVPHRSFRSAIMVYLAGIKRRIGFKFGPWSFFYTDSVPFPWLMHDAERNMLLLKPLEALSKPVFPDFTADDCQLGEIKDIKLKIGINPSSVWETKRWPQEYFISLIKKLYETYQVPPILTGGAKEEQYNKAIEKSLPEGYVINLTGKTDLSSLISLIKAMDIFITNDSGPMHIAVAAKTKVLAIFGPTTKELGFFPYSKDALVIEENLSCRPCKLHGSRKCPRDHFLCMRLITPEKVFKEVSKIVEYDFRKYGE